MTKTKILLFGFLVVALGFGGYYLGKNANPAVETPTKVEDQPINITITNEEIKEANFTGNRVVISGNNLLTQSAAEYVTETIAEFKKSADKDVPELRKTFGADSPPASYAIDIRAERVSGTYTESIIVSVYSYTGGAHGTSVYKTFTATKNGNKMLTLGDMLKPDQQGKFAAMVIERLLAENKAGNLPVFEQDVEVLTFKSFQNWAMDKDNLILYFSQYEIGPGALGSFPFAVPLKELEVFLKN